MTAFVGRRTASGVNVVYPLDKRFPEDEVEVRRVGAVMGSYRSRS